MKKMLAKEKIKIKRVEVVKSHPNFILVDGKKYVLEKETTKKIDNVIHLDKAIFKEFDEREYKHNVKILVDAIAENTAKKELIRELVKDIDLKTVRRLVKRIESGKAIKKQKGCLGFKIGDAYIQLID